jgi:putative endonuclease
MSISYFVYILTNKYNKVFYIGITNNLVKRIWEHKQKFVEGFTNIYNLQKLVYFEIFTSPLDAITREKQLKGWLRKKKIELIEKNNPQYNDLYPEIIK